MPDRATCAGRSSTTRTARSPTTSRRGRGEHRRLEEPAPDAALDARCRALVARARATAAGSPHAVGRAARRAHALPRARDARLPRRARRLRVRDAGPRQRRDHAVRLATSSGRATCRRVAAGEHDRGVRAVGARGRLGRRRDGDDGATRRRRRLLDGAKTWISNGGIADFYTVFARGERRARGLSAFVVDADAPGLRVAERIDVIAPHPLARARVRRLRVRPTLLGEPGEGFKIAMATLDVFRSTVGAAALGFARRALDEALAPRHARASCSARRWPSSSSCRPSSPTWRSAIDASALLVYRAAWTKDVARRPRDPRGGDGQAARDRDRAARRSTTPCSSSAGSA